MLGDQPRQVGGGTERAAVDFGKSEGGVVGGHHDVRVPDDADASAETEPLDGGDHRDLALVDGGEGGEAAPVGADQRLVTPALDLLDVHPGAEPPPLGPDDDHPVVGDPPGVGHRRGQLNQPATSRAFTGGWSMTTSAMPGSF